MSVQRTSEENRNCVAVGNVTISLAKLLFGRERTCEVITPFLVYFTFALVKNYHLIVHDILYVLRVTFQAL